MKLISTSRGLEAKVHRAGLKVAACYGADISGISMNKKKSLRAGAAEAAKWGCTGASGDLIWATEDPRKDPLAQCTTAPLKRYAREWWITTDCCLRVPEALKPAELLEAGGVPLAAKLNLLQNKVWKAKCWPLQWTGGRIVNIWKGKGSAAE